MALDHTKAKKEKKYHFSQMKAVGALVYFKLRRSQTLSVCSKSTRYCSASQLYSNGMVTYVKVSGGTQATKEKKKHV